MYSDTNMGKFHENETSLKPKSKYGNSKLLNERYAFRALSRHVIYLWLVLDFSVYGPFGRPDMAYYSFTKAIKENRAIKLNNQGNMFRDMTFIDDIIQGILGAINYTLNSEHKNKNEIFNLGNDAPIKTSDLLNKIEKNIGKKAIIQHCKTKNENIKTHADITKAKNLLDMILKFL